MLQFISDGSTVAETVNQCRMFLQGGGRWAQIRMKDADDSAVAEAAGQLLPLYRKAGATLIVDDRVIIAHDLGLDGVHLGLSDMNPAEARRILGPDAIIGATANSVEHLRMLRDMPVNYYGIGPFRFTTTKKKLAPVLGLQGYADIIQFMQHTGDNRPFVAIGGITEADIMPLSQIGVRGFAISGAISHATDPVKATASLLALITHAS
ncbi:MAG: thiamine phosphate synthase [Muribaculaceae bacterium]|nr:thiamine phosphate synthase [Muribaculaceae bacterium]